MSFARDLIKDESRWCTEWMAYNSEGIRCPPDSVTACRWCGVGAIYRAASELHLKEVRAAALNVLTRIASRYYQVPRVEVLNDTLGHAALVRGFNLALLGMKDRPTRRSVLERKGAKHVPALRP